MSLRNLALKAIIDSAVLSTITTPVGAPDRELASSPNVVSGGLQLFFVADLNSAVRRSITFRAKAPAYDAKSKTWSKGRREVALSTPMEVSPGVYQSLTARASIEAPASCTSDEIIIKIDELCQVLKDSAAQLFLKVGTLD